MLPLGPPASPSVAPKIKQSLPQGTYEYSNGSGESTDYWKNVKRIRNSKIGKPQRSSHIPPRNRQCRTFGTHSKHSIKHGHLNKGNKPKERLISPSSIHRP